MSIAHSYIVPRPSKPGNPLQFLVNSKIGKKIEIIISQIIKTLSQANNLDL